MPGATCKMGIEFHTDTVNTERTHFYTSTNPNTPCTGTRDKTEIHTDHQPLSIKADSLSNVLNTICFSSWISWWKRRWKDCILSIRQNTQYLFCPTICMDGNVQDLQQMQIQAGVGTIYQTVSVCKTGAEGKRQLWFSPLVYWLPAIIYGIKAYL